MSMFEFPNDYFEKMNSSNPFEAFMPTPDTMNAMVKDWMDMVPVANPFAENLDLAAFNLENADIPNSPVAAAAAGSAIMFGMASQMFGLMAGSMSSAMEQADKLKGDTGEMGFPSFTAAVPNPFKFEWELGTSEPAAPAKAAKPAAVKTAASKTDAGKKRTAGKVTKTTKAVKEMTDEAVRTADALAAESIEAASKSAAANEAAAEAINPAVGSVLKPEVVGEIKSPAPKAKATPAKKTAAAKSKAAPAKKAEAVNDDVAPAELKVATTPVADAEEVMPEDFIKPKVMAKPDTPDDLKLISGVGPKLEQVLNGLGIWTFGQIAEWTPHEIAWVDDYLQFKGRIERDEWLKQAAELAKG